MLIDNFNVMDNIEVTESMVSDWKIHILNHIKEKKTFSLNDIFFNLTKNIKVIEYNADTFQSSIKQLINKISEYMACQEACMDLVIDREIMPVGFRYNSNHNFSNSATLSIEFIEHMESQSTATCGNSIDNIPFIPYDTFILRLSKKI